jgi:4-amino-4-deoxy-L-arabinose transferase-like glycosyltransferase
MLAAALTTLPGLGVGTLWDNSETTYGEVAREILLTGDGTIMHLNAVPWFVQPPLYFWTAALCAKVFGVNAFAMRLPAALATIGMGAAVGLVAQRFLGLRAAILACMILATSLMQAVIGRLAIMDALLDCALTVTVLATFLALQRGCSTAWYVAWVAAALGVLAKGPVAPVVALLVIGAWVLWEQRSAGRVRFPSACAWGIGVVSFLLIIAPWFALLAHAAGRHAFDELLGHYTVGRYMGAIENQSGPVWYYVPVLILGFFPWVVFLTPACIAVWKTASNPDGSFERFCLAWAIVPFVFFSFAQTKLPNYVALEFPALALLTAYWFDVNVIREERRGMLFWAGLVPVAIGIMGIAAVVFSRNNHLDTGLRSLVSDMVGIGTSLLVGSIACFCLLAAKRTAAYAPFALGAAMLSAMLIIAFGAEPHAERFKPVPVLAEVVQHERKPGDAVAIWGVSGSNALLFYTQPPIIEFTPVGESEQVRTAICSAKRVFMVTSPKRLEKLAFHGRRGHELAVAAGDVLYLYDGAMCLP